MSRTEKEAGETGAMAGDGGPGLWREVARDGFWGGVSGGEARPLPVLTVLALLRRELLLPEHPRSPSHAQRSV